MKALYNIARINLLRLVIFIAVPLSLFSFFYSINHASKLAIDNHQSGFELNSAYLVAEKDDLTIEQILLSSGFKSIVENQISYEFGDHAYWFKYEIYNSNVTEEELVLFFLIIM